MKKNEPHYHLKRSLKRKIQSKPGYSQNSLARDLGVSATFVAHILSGKKPIPFDRLEDLFFHLELDVQERQDLVRSMIYQQAGKKIANQIFSFSASAKMKSRKKIEGPHSGVLDDWSILAVMQGLSLDHETQLPIEEVLSQKLSLDLSRVKMALDVLEAHQLIERSQGKIILLHKHSYIPTGRTRAEVRRFHEQMIDKAKYELTNKTSTEDFEKRLITGFTFVANPDKVESAKVQIQNFLDKLSRQMSNGHCSEIYQCNVQLFPLSKK